MSEVKTYGEKINDMVEEYFQMYLSMLQHPIEGITDIEGLAKHDIKMGIFVREQALAKLENKISDYKARVNN